MVTSLVSPKGKQQLNYLSGRASNCSNLVLGVSKIVLFFITIDCTIGVLYLPTHITGYAHELFASNTLNDQVHTHEELI